MQLMAQEKNAVSRFFFKTTFKGSLLTFFLSFFLRFFFVQTDKFTGFIQDNGTSIHQKKYNTDLRKKQTKYYSRCLFKHFIYFDCCSRVLLVNKKSFSYFALFRFFFFSWLLRDASTNAKGYKIAVCVFFFLKGSTLLQHPITFLQVPLL